MVQTKESQYFCQEKKLPHLLSLPNLFVLASDCLQLCPRLGAGGRVPSIGNLSNSLSLTESYSKTLLESELQDDIYIVAPFVWDSNTFVDFYNNNLMSTLFWVPGEPNGNGSQQFTCLYTKRGDGKMEDTFNMYSTGYRCQCWFPYQPVLRLRGICKGSNIDNIFTLIYHNQNVIYRGLTNTEVQFSKSSLLPTWILSVNSEHTIAQRARLVRIWQDG